MTSCNPKLPRLQASTSPAKATSQGTPCLLCLHVRVYSYIQTHSDQTLPERKIPAKIGQASHVLQNPQDAPRRWSALRPWRPFPRWQLPQVEVCASRAGRCQLTDSKSEACSRCQVDVRHRVRQHVKEPELSKAAEATCGLRVTCGSTCTGSGRP